MTDTVRTLPTARGRTGRLFTALALGLVGAACSESPLDPLGEPGAPGSLQTARVAAPELHVEQVSETEVVARWTEVDDGTGGPAAYTVRYASPRLAWPEGETVCEVEGHEVGEERSCSIEKLEPGHRYEFQLRAYRVTQQEPSGASFSNLVTIETEEPEPAAPEAPAPRTTGIWISPAEIMERPTSGPAWENVLATASGDCGKVDLSDQEQMANVCVLAKALVFVRTGTAGYRDDVLEALGQIADLPKYKGRALALGRELGTYVMAADLIDLPEVDEELDARFRAALKRHRRTWTSGAAANLIDCHEKRPNNWGAHCGASRIAIAIYLDDRADLERAAKVFRGYIGDRSAYAGFTYGPDLSWQCDPKKPVGINPVGCERDGLSMDGILADDQRRGGKFTKRPPKENYVWEALQGLVAQAVMLHREGYDAFEWEDRALLRAARWLHDVNDFPAVGDDVWQASILNHYYGTSFPVAAPRIPGKNLAWTDWTHS